MFGRQPRVYRAVAARPAWKLYAPAGRAFKFGPLMTGRRGTENYP